MLKSSKANQHLFLYQTLDDDYSDVPDLIEVSDDGFERVYTGEVVGTGKKRKYKPVAKKVKPVQEPLPEEFRIIRRIPSDPLLGLPVLPTQPPEFKPTVHMTEERMKGFNLDKDDFLWPEEQKLMSFILVQHEKLFAWKETERGRFRSDYFPPVKMAVKEHTPWSFKHLPIPPAAKDQLIELLRSKIEAGVYEPSNSAYRA